VADLESLESCANGNLVLQPEPQHFSYLSHIRTSPWHREILGNAGRGNARASLNQPQKTVIGFTRKRDRFRATHERVSVGGEMDNDPK
jgi:hypothetical protein